MKSFNLNTQLVDFYDNKPQTSRRPIIGITTNYEGVDATVRDRYYHQIIAAGGTPVLIPPVADRNVLLDTLETIDALLLTGGGDFNPLWADEEPSPALHNINNVRDLPELLITRLAFDRQIPMLGICRGVQTLAVALGGRVHQDISHEPTNYKHSQDADRSEPTHTVEIEKGSVLYNIYKEERIFVNSFHHQAVAAPGERFKITARALDGVVEAIESSEHRRCSVCNGTRSGSARTDCRSSSGSWRKATCCDVRSCSTNVTSRSTHTATRRCSSHKACASSSVTLKCSTTCIR